MYVTVLDAWSWVSPESVFAEQYLFGGDAGAATGTVVEAIGSKTKPQLGYGLRSAANWTAWPCAQYLRET